MQAVRTLYPLSFRPNSRCCAEFSLLDPPEQFRRWLANLDKIRQRRVRASLAHATLRTRQHDLGSSYLVKSICFIFSFPFARSCAKLVTLCVTPSHRPTCLQRLMWCYLLRHQDCPP